MPMLTFKESSRLNQESSGTLQTMHLSILAKAGILHLFYCCAISPKLNILLTDLDPVPNLN